MTRLPPIAPEEMYFEQRRVVQAINKRRKPSVSSKGGIGGPFLALLYVPTILDRMQYLGEHCRFDTGLPAHLRELAICITARHVGAQLEFHVHAMEAREFGLPEEAIEAVAAKRRPANPDEDVAIVYDFVTEMYATGTVSDALFAKAEKRFGKPVIIDLIVTCGYYKTLGTVITVGQLPIPPYLADGFVPPFPLRQTEDPAMRFPPLNPKDMTPRQREVAEAIEKRRSGGLAGPYPAMVYSPEVADRAQMLGEYLRFNLRLPEPLRAIAVLVAAGRHRAADVTPFLATEGIKDSGLAEAKLKALAEARRPEGMSEGEAIAHDFCFELSRTGRVKNATFEKAAARFGKEICLEMVAICGFTAMQTTMLNITGSTQAEA